MSLFVFLIVLVAAFLHAFWNVLVKFNIDRFLSLFLLQSIMGLMGVVMLLVFASPSMASLPYALTSGILHTGYNLFLARSYRTGDLSVVYPVARGSAPLITLAASFMFTHDSISPFATAGIIILILGIWFIALGPSKAVRVDRNTLLFALGTSVFIGCYTVVDGLGGRASGAPSGYTGLVFLLDAVFLFSIGIYLRGPQILRDVVPYWRSGIVGAAASGSAYWIVIWAMSVAPIAMVAALRETSILIALGLSAKVLNERLTASRIIGAILVVAGAIALRS